MTADSSKHAGKGEKDTVCTCGRLKQYWNEKCWLCTDLEVVEQCKTNQDGLKSPKLSDG